MSRALRRRWKCWKATTRAAWEAGGIWSRSSRGIGGANVIIPFYKARQGNGSGRERLRFSFYLYYSWPGNTCTFLGATSTSMYPDPPSAPIAPVGLGRTSTEYMPPIKYSPGRSQ